MTHKRFGKRRRFGVQLPSDFQWKILDTYIKSNRRIDEQHKKQFITAIRSRDIDKLLNCSEAFSPQCICGKGYSAEKFSAYYQASAFLKKFPFKTESSSRAKKALDGFIAAEEQCERTNCRLDHFDQDFTTSGIDRAPSLMRNFIRRVLGKLDLNEIALDARHGPGASLGTRNGKVSVYYKYSDMPYTVTERCAPYFRALIRSDRRWAQAIRAEYCADYRAEPDSVCVEGLLDMVIETVPGNRITLVPKDGRKDRTIAIEPLGNLMLQLGVDGFIRKRLKRFGCDLDSQQKNQELARVASEGLMDYATVDLSAASDSISLACVRYLFPLDWYNFLLDLRSPYGTVSVKGVPDYSIRYEKISSMGNGYTFVLESLIFLAAVYAAMKITGTEHISKAAVYGDDIVIPRSALSALYEIFDILGFSINQEKSFSVGPFRESCGCDYYQGVPVRPLFIKKEVTHVKHLFAMVNRLRHQHLWQIAEGLDGAFVETLNLVEDWVPDWAYAYLGPPSKEEFDTYLHVYREHLPKSLRKKFRYTFGCYNYKRIITCPLPQNGNKFYFRKLMATLHPTPMRSLYDSLWDVNKGGVFTVTKRSALYTKTTNSRSSLWPANPSALYH